MVFRFLLNVLQQSSLASNPVLIKPAASNPSESPPHPANRSNTVNLPFFGLNTSLISEIYGVLDIASYSFLILN